MIVMAILMIKLVRRESDARVEKKIKLDDMLETEKRWLKSLCKIALFEIKAVIFTQAISREFLILTTVTFYIYAKKFCVFK